jgi:hypothetical protein
MAAGSASIAQRGGIGEKRSEKAIIGYRSHRVAAAIMAASKMRRRNKGSISSEKSGGIAG